MNYNEVTDIAPDMRITFYNSGHVLGSAMVHINIGNGLHNLLYTADQKFGRTRLLNPAVTTFPRLETVIIEATYGGKDNILPPREQTEDRFIEIVKETIAKGGKALMPELGLGHSQESLLRVEEAVRTGELPKVPVYVDGMIWDITAIHTAYPDFLSSNIRQQIFQGSNPFASEILQRVGSPAERKQVIEGGPCIIISTSGMLNGGASVEYLKYLADNPNNVIFFSCYQGAGSLGRQIKEGAKEVVLDNGEPIKIKMRVEILEGLSSHSDRRELVNFINRCSPKPKRVITQHGEASRCLDFASTIYKLSRAETDAPRNLETIRLR